MAEQSEKLLIADKRLAELEANLNTKRETENKEMVKQLKSIMKEEIAALKSKVRETHSTFYVCCSLVGYLSSIWSIYIILTRVRISLSSCLDWTFFYYSTKLAQRVSHSSQPIWLLVLPIEELSQWFRCSFMAYFKNELIYMSKILSSSPLCCRFALMIFTVIVSYFLTYSVL